MAEKWIQKAVPESHRGRFTEWAKRQGMSVAQGVAHVLGSKDKYGQTRIGQALFAQRMRAMASKRR